MATEVITIEGKEYDVYIEGDYAVGRVPGTEQVLLAIKDDGEWKEWIVLDTERFIQMSMAVTNLVVFDDELWAMIDPEGSMP